MRIVVGSESLKFRTVLEEETRSEKKDKNPVKVNAGVRGKSEDLLYRYHSAVQQKRNLHISPCL